MKIRLNIDSQPFTRKPNGGEVGAIKKRIATLTREVTTQELARFIGAGYTTQAGETQLDANGNPTEQGWKSQQAIYIDIDNDIEVLGENGQQVRDPATGKYKKRCINNPVTPNEARKILAEYGMQPSIIYYSFSNKPEWPRFRMVFILAEVITDLPKVKDYTARIMQLFAGPDPESSGADTGTSNGDRLFYGTNGVDKVFYLGEHLVTLEALEALPEPLTWEKDETPRSLEVTKAPEVVTIQKEDARRDLATLKDLYRRAIYNYDLRDHIDTYLPGHVWKRAGKVYYCNPCPICGHNNDFWIEGNNGNYWKCMGAGGKRAGNIVNFIAIKHGMSIPEAAEFVKFDLLGFSKQEERRAYAKMKEAEEQLKAQHEPVPEAQPVEVADVPESVTQEPAEVYYNHTTQQAVDGLLVVARSMELADTFQAGGFVIPALLNGNQEQAFINDLANRKPEYTIAFPEIMETSFIKSMKKTGVNYILVPINKFEAPDQYIKRCQLLKDKTPEQIRAELNLQRFLVNVFSETYIPVPTGLDFLDDLLGGGITRGTLTLLLAAPAAGKTTLYQIVAESFASQGRDVLYFNLEMTADQMYSKVLSARLSKRLHDVVTANMVLRAYEQEENLQAEIQNEAEQYFISQAAHIEYIDATASGTRPLNEPLSDLDNLLEFIEDRAETAKEEGKEAPAVFVDYLHLLTSKTVDNTADLVKEALNKLKGYATKYNSYVFTISAVNRDSMKGGFITLNSGRDSSGIEFSGDYILSLNYRDYEDSEPIKDKDGNTKGYKKLADPLDINKAEELQQKKPRRMRIRVLKHRMGTTNHANVSYYADINRFEGGAPAPETQPDKTPNKAVEFTPVQGKIDLPDNF